MIGKISNETGQIWKEAMWVLFIIILEKRQNIHLMAKRKKEKREKENAINSEHYVLHAAPKGSRHSHIVLPPCDF